MLRWTVATEIGILTCRFDAIYHATGNALANGQTNEMKGIEWDWARY